MKDTITTEQFWKDKYHEMVDERNKFITIASSITGFSMTIAEYSDAMPDRDRIRILEQLIKVWSKNDPDSDVTRDWIEGWKETIEKISK